MSKIIIAIDGYSSTGKSTFAKLVAASLGLIYFDTGALYRGVTLYAIKNSLVTKSGDVDEEGLKEALKSLSSEFRVKAQGEESELYLNGVNVNDKIRSLEVSGKVSIIARVPFVREYVDNILHALGKSRGVVMDGRDIGTAVFPDAELKIFMTADPKIRAKRRFDEMAASGEHPDFDAILANLLERDKIDASRENNPLRMASDAILLDNSNMTIKEQLDWLKKIIEERWN